MFVYIVLERRNHFAIIYTVDLNLWAESYFIELFKIQLLIHARLIWYSGATFHLCTDDMIDALCIGH